MYYTLSEKEVLSKLKTKESGLSENEAKLRLNQHGLNELKKTKHLSKTKIFLSQFKSYIIYILIGATVISLIAKEYIDALVISIILLLNSVLGFVQEYKAEKSLEALKKLSNPKAIVIRDNQEKEIDAKYLVPGDIIVLYEGSKVPADARLLESYSLRVNESSLTGESMPVGKTTSTLKNNLMIQKQTNMVFAGTSVVLGHGKAVVTATNMQTELGKIAKEIQEIEDTQTPLQLKLKKLGTEITIAVLIICGLMVLFGYFYSFSITTLFLTSIALAVAAIPEGLPAIVTICLALGTQRMIKKNVLIRKLHAVETLGSTTIICTDKTGTLTKNEMTVTEIFANNKLIEVSGTGYQLKGEFRYKNKEINPKELTTLFQIATQCNNSSLSNISDPTEKALIVLAKKANYTQTYKRLDELPFSSERKYMSTIDLINNKKIYHFKGAPEIILNKCKKILINNKSYKLDKKTKELIFSQQAAMAKKALRVLALAYASKKEEIIFVGLVGMIDPPREEVKQSILLCKNAGIRIIMITGDHPITAKAVGQSIGITGDIITGEELDSLSETELINCLKKTNIFARVSPNHKSKILDALKKQGEIVAMTGDGVNDAPALKKADIGAAVGSGTDVAKEAADIVLLDDNFTSIVNAVEEGRHIYANIKKFIAYLFACNLGEVSVIFFSILIGLPLPLIAIQILWVNLLTDGLPALALGVDPISEKVMNKPPRNPKEPIINKSSLIRILTQASIVTIGVLVLFVYFKNNNSLPYAQTAAFTTVVFFQLFIVLNYRTNKTTLFSKEFFKNKYLLLAIASSILLQIVVVYFLNSLFKTTPLILSDWFLIIFVASSVFFIEEIIKLIIRKNSY